MNYLWIDMEMSGLDPETCRILEVAAIVTDENFSPLEQYEAIVFQPASVLDAMDDWCKETHGKSGLTAAVANGKPEAQVEKEILSLLEKYFKPEEKPILCGNSIGQDRKFIDQYMVNLSKKLHYRMLDVTSFKLIFKEKFKIEFSKKGNHRAVDDILESISELKHYLSFIKVN